MTKFNQDRQVPHGTVIGRYETEFGGHADAIYTKSWIKRIWYDWGICEIVE